jgi:2-succinyl-5-enolpyruvyl-6-hydroxy-3-cyclohexene-1-carboxylate synthase
VSDTRDTYTLLRAFVDELVRCGVRHAATSPGSRSTPLVLSLVRDERLTCWSHVDERSGAFFALGAAKATGMPAVLACTSGTAAANYAPAVIEASQAGVPLIVLTADRPPELREVGAGQTIDQIKLYGSAARWFFEVGTHAATPDRLRWLRQLACRAVWRSLEGAGGVVHLNFALREPLVLDDELPPDDSGRPDGAPWTRRIAGDPDPSGAAAWVAASPRGIIVAGSHGTGADLPALAEALGWPLLADPLSGARRGSAAIAHYDALLRHDGFRAGARPERVLRIGDLPTSKPLRQWLRDLDVPQAAVFPGGVWHDPDAVVAEVFDAVPAPADWPRDDRWIGVWRQADATAARALDGVLGDELSEPMVARELAAVAEQLVVASSMPIRDVETFAASPRGRVLSNRGANGIDGTISTAYGAAAASGVPTVLHVGDVALAHDLGGLLTGSRHGIPLTIVVVDNGGGGIFDFLPVATQHDAFEEHVATPTGLEVARVADLFGAEYRPVSTVGELRAALDPPSGTRLVHVRTDRAANVALHRRCWDAVATALAPTVRATE